MQKFQAEHTKVMPDIGLNTTIIEQVQKTSTENKCRKVSQIFQLTQGMVI